MQNKNKKVRIQWLRKVVRNFHGCHIHFTKVQIENFRIELQKLEKEVTS